MGAGDVEVNVTTNTGRSCAVFDGVDDSVKLGLDPVGLGSVTISFWCMTYGWGGSGYGRIFDDGKFKVFLNNANAVFDAQNDGSNSASSANNSIVFNVWQHWIITREGTDFNFYLNNVLTNGADHTSGNPTAPDYNMYIGNRDGDARGHNGCISDFKIWDKILTASERATVYAGGVVSDGLTHRWKLHNDYKDSVGDADGTNAGSILQIRDDAIAAAIAADRTTANDKYMMVGMPGGQVVTGIIEEA